MQINKLPIQEVAKDLLKNHGASFAALVAGIETYFIYSAAKGMRVAPNNEKAMIEASERLSGFDARKELIALIESSTVAKVARKLKVTQTGLFELKKDKKRNPSTRLSNEVFKIWESWK